MSILIYKYSFWLQSWALYNRNFCIRFLVSAFRKIFISISICLYIMRIFWDLKSRSVLSVFSALCNFFLKPFHWKCPLDFQWKWTILPHRRTTLGFSPQCDLEEIETSRDRPKSAPYPRLKNSKKTSKCQVFFYSTRKSKIFRKKMDRVARRAR